MEDASGTSSRRASSEQPTALQRFSSRLAAICVEFKDDPGTSDRHIDGGREIGRRIIDSRLATTADGGRPR